MSGEPTQRAGELSDVTLDKVVRWAHDVNAGKEPVKANGLLTRCANIITDLRAALALAQQERDEARARFDRQVVWSETHAMAAQQQIDALTDDLRAAEQALAALRQAIQKIDDTYKPNVGDELDIMDDVRAALTRSQESQP